MKKEKTLSDLCFSIFLRKMYTYLKKNDENSGDFTTRICKMIIGDNGDNRYIDAEEKEFRFYLDDLVDVTYKGYYNGSKKLSKNTVRNMLKYYNKEYIKDYFSILDTQQQNGVMKELSYYFSDVNENNCDEKFCFIIYKILELTIDQISVDEFPLNKHNQTIDVPLTSDIVSSLYLETEGYCPMCNKLFDKVNDNILYKIKKIEISNINNKENLIALCPTCSSKLDLNDTEYINEVKAVKKALSINNACLSQISNISFYDILYSLINNLFEQIEKTDDFTELDYKKIILSSKISNDKMLRNKVRNNIINYFITISDAMELHERYKQLSLHIQELYLNIKEYNYSREKVFNLLTEDIQRKAKAPRSYCEALISYYIYTCEVFENEVSK